MCFADDADDYRALLDGFLCIFDLKDAALGRAMMDQHGCDYMNCIAYKVIESLS